MTKGDVEWSRDGSESLLEEGTSRPKWSTGRSISNPIQIWNTVKGGEEEGMRSTGERNLRVNRVEINPKMKRIQFWIEKESKAH